MRLWLWSAPLVMLALAVLFAVVAAGDGRWGLVAVMALLALAALALMGARWWVLRRLRGMGR